VLCERLVALNGLNPSLANLSLMLRVSRAKFECFASKSFHTWASTECLNFPSLERFSAQHLNVLAVFEYINSLFNHGIKGKYLITLAGTL
jgi:hypothetical protein